LNSDAVGQVARNDSATSAAMAVRPPLHFRCQISIGTSHADKTSGDEYLKIASNARREIFAGNHELKGKFYENHQ
jgi:hypothetical protein